MSLAGLLGAVVIFAAHFVFGLAGFGVGLVAMAFLPFIMSPATAIVLMTVYAMIFAIVLFVPLRRDCTPRAIVGLVVGSLLGTPAGVWILAVASASVLNRLIGLMLVIVVALEFANRLPRRLPGRGWGLGAGVLAGLIGGAVGLPGPPTVIYATTQGWSPRTFKANLQAFFIVNQSVTVASYWVAGLLTAEVLRLTASYFVPATIGIAVGMAFFDRVDAARFRRIVFVLLFPRARCCSWVARLQSRPEVQVYVARRLLLFIPTLLGASLLIFVLLRLVPGDIAQILVYQTGSEQSSVQEKQIRQIRAELGLDKPVLVQFMTWLRGAVLLDFGESFSQRRPVRDILIERFPRSMELAALTMALAMVWAIPLGVISAVRQNTWLDYLVRVLSISGLSLPIFFTGVLILYLLVRFFRYLPPLEYSALTENPAENLKQMIWPALAQAYYIAAPIMRLTRSQMLEVVRQDYVRTARAKGLSNRVVIYRHALRNSLLPVVTFIGWWGGRLLGGVVIMEIIFAVPGMGTALVQAVSFRDYPTVQAIVFVMALIFLVVNLVVDLLYAWLDPRIRLA